MEQEKNNKGVIALLVVIIVILLALVVLLATGTISFKSNEPNSNQTSENTNNSTTNATDKTDSMDNAKEDLASLELDELNTFFDVYKSNENALMEFVTFSSPSELLNKNVSNITNNLYYLQMILSGSKYAEEISGEHVRRSKITLSGIKSQLKDLTNYNYSDEEVKKCFGNLYNEDDDVFVIPTPGGAAMAGEITSSYKIGDKYYISLSNNISVVLQKINNKYYFYSSTGWTE